MHDGVIKKQPGPGQPPLPNDPALQYATGVTSVMAAQEAAASYATAMPAHGSALPIAASTALPAMPSAQPGVVAAQPGVVAATALPTGAMSSVGANPVSAAAAAAHIAATHAAAAHMVGYATQ